MSEPTEEALNNTIDSLLSAQYNAAHAEVGQNLDCAVKERKRIKGIVMGMFRAQRERIAALERDLAFAEETISECVAKSAIVDLWHAPERAAAPAPDAALRELRAWLLRDGGEVAVCDTVRRIDELLAAKPAPAATTAAPAVGDDELDEGRRWLQEYFDSGEKLTPSARAVAELCRRELARRNP